MTKKQKRIVMYLAAFLVALALISICLVGNTFARFVTNGSKAAQTTVATYKVEGSNGVYGSTAVSFGGLSPDETGSTNGIGSVSNDSSPTQVAIITVTDTDVNIDLTISYTNLVGYTDNWTNAITSTGAYTSGNTAVSATDIANVFSLNIAYRTTTTGTAATLSGTTGTDLDGWNYSNISWSNTDDGKTVTITDAVAAMASTPTYPTIISIYAWVTWTTDYDTYSGTGNTGAYLADELDTLIGQTVYGLQSTVTVQAVQGSEVPTTA